MRERKRFVRRGLRLLTCVALIRGAAAFGSEPWATSVVSYNPGTAMGSGLTDPQVLLGEPERFTGEGVFPGAVTPFNPPFLPQEIVAVGVGGHLTVALGTPATNDPSHLYGVDLIIFGNGFFNDASYPNGIVNGLAAEGPFSVSVSANGIDFISVGTQFNDGRFPPLGWLDLADPYSPNPGNVPSDFLRPVNPALTIGDFLGKSFGEVVKMYDGSGGGVPIDIASSGLASVQYVRIEVAPGASIPEFDAISVVPEPSTALCALAGLSALAMRRRIG